MIDINSNYKLQKLNQLHSRLITATIFHFLKFHVWYCEHVREKMVHDFIHSAGAAA